MRILQVATSLGQSCGIGHFAGTMHRRLAEHGHEVISQAALRPGGHHDLIILHHHSELLPDAEVERLIAASTRPVLLFAHADDARQLYPLVDGVIGMAPGLLRQTDRPTCFFPHPAWVPSQLSDRDELRAELGLPQDRYLVGTNGFLKFEREFDRAAEHLLRAAQSAPLFLYLVLSPWRLPSPGLMERLERLKRQAPDKVRIDYGFLGPEALNKRLQACDLLWCWTRAASSAYASGVVSDQYASGTRMVVAEKAQHAHVLHLDNVLPVQGGLEDICRSILAEARAGSSTRHDPAPVSWNRVLPELSAFLQRFAP